MPATHFVPFLLYFLSQIGLMNAFRQALVTTPEPLNTPQGSLVHNSGWFSISGFPRGFPLGSSALLRFVTVSSIPTLWPEKSMIPMSSSLTRVFWVGTVGIRIGVVSVGSLLANIPTLRVSWWRNVIPVTDKSPVNDQSLSPSTLCTTLLCQGPKETQLPTHFCLQCGQFLWVHSHQRQWPSLKFLALWDLLRSHLKGYAWRCQSNWWRKGQIH